MTRTRPEQIGRSPRWTVRRTWYRCRSTGTASTLTGEWHPRPGLRPTYAVPAAVRKLCGDGLARPEAVGRDPSCPQVLGSAALHPDIKRHNNACW